MKYLTFICVLFALLLSACGNNQPAPTMSATPLPTNTSIPTSTSTQVPMIDVDGIQVPDPKVTNPELFDITKPDSPIPQFINAMKMAGIDVTDQDIEYALEYYDAIGKYHSPFLSWAYRAGDPPINVDTDLSMLTGQSVDFVLALRPENGSSAQDDGGLWIAPVIYRPNP